MSLIRSQHLAAYIRAAAAGDEAEFAALARRHPEMARTLAPLLAMLGNRTPAAVALQALDQQGLVLNAAQQLAREQAAQFVAHDNGIRMRRVLKQRPIYVEEKGDIPFRDRRERQVGRSGRHSAAILL